MTGTTHYGWTLMAESQSQKFQTFNDDLQAIDTELYTLATGGISLVAATDTVLGGIKVGEGLSMAVTSELLSVIYGTSSGTAAQGNDTRITGALQSTGGTMSGALHLSVPGSSDDSDKATSTSWVRTYVTGLGFGTGSGTVTSVALTVPGILSVSGSPVTTSGTLALSLATQSANLLWAGPTTGSAATPTFRSLVTADLPAGVGTVTSVAMTVPAWLSVAGSPVTSSGTLAVTASNQNANIVLAGPSTGAAATPAFRALVAADLPSGFGSSIPYDIGFFAEGTLTTSEVIARFVCPRALSLASGASGVAICGVAPTGATAVVTLTKNGSSIGTVTYATGSTTGTVSITGSTSFAIGDIIGWVGPASVDATLADPSVTLTATRS